MAQPEHNTDVRVETKGDVSPQAHDYAVEKMQRLFLHAHRPVLLARVKLTHGTDRDADRPDVAEASFDLNGRLIRGQVAAESMTAAIDLLVDRMARQLERVADRERTKHRRRAETGPGEWRHGDRPTERPDYFPRAEDEREIVVHKSFGVGGATLEEAAFDMDVLDYDFFLYIDADERDDRVVHRTNGSIEMLKDPPTETVNEAIERLDAGGERFVFFRDPDNGRGAIAYRRYDGHYGLIRPVDG